MLPRRRFGESRYSREDNKSRTNFGRYGGGDDEEEAPTGPGRFRSRFLRPGDDDDDLGGKKNAFFFPFLKQLRLTLMS